MFSEPEKNIDQFHIDPGMVVADLGAGTGAYAFPLAKAVGPSGKVYAVDVQKELIAKLKSDANQKQITNIEIIWGDLDDPKGTTLRESSVDRIVVANTFFQIEDKDEFMKEVHRILRTNGLLLFIDWKGSFGGVGPKGEDIVTPDVVRTLFEDAGFTFERDVQAGDHHYGMIFKEL